jgi:hypothetical protein
MNSQIEGRLQDVTKRIVETFNPYRIIIFGSYAYGKPNEVVFPKTHDLLELHKLCLSVNSAFSSPYPSFSGEMSC